MEIVIVICLFIVIILLVSEKIVIKKITYKKEDPASSEPDLPEIMGKPKPVKSHLQPNTANKSQIEEPEINPDNLDIEYDENEEVNIQIPQEELDEVFSNTPDWEEEEEEWKRYGISTRDNGFAQEVTYDELSSVEALLQKEILEQAQKDTAVAIVQRLQGTELFSLLENSIEGASQKIAKLLDDTLTTEIDANSSSLRKNNFEDFDIGEFI